MSICPYTHAALRFKVCDLLVMKPVSLFLILVILWLLSFLTEMRGGGSTPMRFTARGPFHEYMDCHPREGEKATDPLVKHQIEARRLFQSAIQRIQQSPNLLVTGRWRRRAPPPELPSTAELRNGENFGAARIGAETWRPKFEVESHGLQGREARAAPCSALGGAPRGHSSLFRPPARDERPAHQHPPAPPLSRRRTFAVLLFFDCRRL
mmetsp:Transcript_18503/g.53359  ORF Transcript_18503/g.53359 Transcript_18503/m.53359 type:complete len:209 (+) Transcript_18503:370-996(+)